MNSNALWLILAAVFVFAVALDLRRGEETFRQALIWTGIWFAAALALIPLIAIVRDGSTATAYATAYLVERSLSIDNVFVFASIFAALAVPERSRGRVLLWGVVGAIVLRAVLLAIGVELVTKFAWVGFVLGVLLIVVGIRMAKHQDTVVDPEGSRVFRVFRRFVPMSDAYEGAEFSTRRNGRLLATPLAAALAMVIAADVLFAVDSIPAVLAISEDLFVVVAANAMALIGLRSLYSCLAGLMGRFRYLHFGLAAILVFVGAKMISAELFGKINPLISLAVIVAILAVSIVASERVANKSGAGHH